MTDRSSWPDVLRRIAELVGDELALELAAREGGLDNFYIPRVADPTHPWAEIVGAEAWAKIVGEYGGERISLPRGMYRDLKKVAILELGEQGLSHREIARRVRVGERYVRRVMGMLEDGSPRPAIEHPAQTRFTFEGE